MPGIRMEEVSFEDGYQLNILLSNGHRIIYNLRPKLCTARFHDISDRRIYEKGKLVNGKVIRWNDNTELSLGEIMINVNNIHL